MIIYAEDIAFASQAFKTAFESIKAASTSMKKQVDTFTKSKKMKNDLKGSWDTIRNYMGAYSPCFEKLNNVCDTLSNNIVSANNSVIKAMDGHSFVDINSEEKLNLQIRNINLLIQEANANLYKKRKEVDKNGKVKFVQTGEISSYWSGLIEKYEADIRELNSLIQVVRNTKEAYEAAKGALSGDAMDFLNAFINKSSKFL